MLEQPIANAAGADVAKKVNLMNLTRAQMREFFAELGEKVRKKVGAGKGRSARLCIFE